MATDTKTKVVVPDHEGLVSSWIAQGSELAEKAVATTFNVTRDLRGEIAQRIGRRIDWIESNQQARIKLFRGLNDRFGKLADDAIDSGENMALSVVSLLRSAGYGVLGAGTRATSSLIKPRDEKVPRAA